MELRVLSLYPEQMNIYADRGNIEVFRRRGAWHGIDVEVRGLEPGETFEPGEHDLEPPSNKGVWPIPVVIR